MSRVSWQATHPVKAKDLAELPYPLLHDRLQQQLACIPHSARNPAMQRFMATHFDWLPRHTSEVKLDSSSKGKVLDYVDALVQAKCSKASCSQNADLCSQIMSGVLDGDCVARTMITGILHKATKVQQGSKRQNTSKLPGIEPHAIAEVGFALASCARQESLMKMFGLLAPKQTGVDIWRDHLPLFFAPGLTAEQAGGRSQVEKNARLVLTLFGQECLARRDYMICWDETTYWPQYNLQAFPEPTGMAYMGGADSRAVLPASTLQELCSRVIFVKHASLTSSSVLRRGKILSTFICCRNDKPASRQNLCSTSPAASGTR